MDTKKKNHLVTLNGAVAEVLRNGNYKVMLDGSGKDALIIEATLAAKAKLSLSVGDRVVVRANPDHLEYGSKITARA